MINPGTLVRIVSSPATDQAKIVGLEGVVDRYDEVFELYIITSGTQEFCLRAHEFAVVDLQAAEQEAL